MPQSSDLFYVRNKAGEYWDGYGWTKGSSRILYHLVNGDSQALTNIARGVGGELEPMGGRRPRRWWERWAGWVMRWMGR